MPSLRSRTRNDTAFCYRDFFVSIRELKSATTILCLNNKNHKMFVSTDYPWKAVLDLTKNNCDFMSPITITYK